MLLDRYTSVRAHTVNLCKPLCSEDCMVQSAPDVSPPKWHLAHTTWFFENFVLPILNPRYSPFREEYRFIFNSYYKTLGPHLEKDKRAFLSRPTLDEVYRYRQNMDECLLKEWNAASDSLRDQAKSVLVLGLHHEQQHQELLLMDIKHNFWSNPLRPVYSEMFSEPIGTQPTEGDWTKITGGIHTVGAKGPDGTDGSGFSFDNERPAHETLLQSFRIKNRPVTNGEFCEFIDSGGYRKPEYWLSDGWITVQNHDWEAPLYWEKRGRTWWVMTLSGMKALVESAPAVHLSYYEADAFCRWSRSRLPTEFEWEVAARSPTFKNQPLVWEWTQSAYLPYPGFSPSEGSLGEYNAKFMCNQMVLRGGSFGTPPGHARVSYRNFFPPSARWMFSGMRVVES